MAKKAKTTKYRQEIDQKPATNRPNYYLKRVSLAKQRKRLLNVLERDIRKLLEKSQYEQLNKDEAQQVCNYLKMIREMEKDEDKNLGNLSDAELEKLAANELKPSA